MSHKEKKNDHRVKRGEIWGVPMGVDWNDKPTTRPKAPTKPVKTRVQPEDKGYSYPPLAGVVGEDNGQPL